MAADLPDRDDQQLEQQREAFRAVYPQVELGDWAPVAEHETLLGLYVLWPDLRAAWFRAKVNTADHGEIESFLDEYGILKPARELRYRYALHLANENRLADYYRIYQQYYQGLEIAKLDCLALRAEIEDGRENRIVSRARDLWLVGTSQDEACDPVFANLRNRQLLTDKEYAARYALAIEARQFTLARYLSRPLGDAYRDQATTWLAAQNGPLDFIKATDARQDEELDREQLAYAVQRLAYSEPLTADLHWRQLQQQFSFSAQLANRVSRHIALWSARLHQPEAAGLLSALPAGAQNTETGRWLVRANLLAHRWAEVIRGIDALPADESGKNEWQYWKAVAHRETGNEQAADAIFYRLANERDFYGFLAADAVDVSYALDARALTDEPAVADEISKLPALVRARELFYVGLEGRGRSEWDAAVSPLSHQQQVQAALLAHQWGWHSRAIATVAKAGAYDDLQIRYPLPWRQDFEQHAQEAGITDSWAYGVARSESLFMRDIRSSAGAIGLMQLMPATGRQAAREIQLPYAGLTTLTDSGSNIRLGTYYLSKMYNRFGENRVLATAAYNAGPHRVENWLPVSGSLDARIWIENIPYNETRGYVRRVLTDEAIFHWRMTGQQRRISDELPNVVAATSQASSTD